MGIRNKIGAIDIRNVRPINWPIYWAGQSEVLFFGEVSKITGGLLYNQVRGATDYLTVTGAAGSYTFQCPDTAAYIAADTDTLWVDGFGVLRTVTTAELIGYDFTRTIVKYADTSPYALEAIMILNADISAEKEDKLHSDFHLPVYWSGVWNDNGYLKENRPLSERYVYPGNAFDSDAEALINRMIAAAETPVLARQQLINSIFIALKTAGLYTKADAFGFIAAHGPLSAFMNWTQDDHNLSLLTTPAFTIDRGYQGADADMVMLLDYLPSADTVNFTQNSASIALYSETDVARDRYNFYLLDPGGKIGILTKTAGNLSVYTINSTETNIANTNGSGFYLASKTSAVGGSYYKDKIKTDFTKASIALPDQGMYIDARNITIGFWWLGGGLTEAEENDLYDIAVDSYLATVGAKV